MRLTKSDEEQIIAAVATQRMVGNKDVLIDMRRAITNISLIRGYGEISGEKFNRNLRTESNAYGYVISGVPLDINKAVRPIMSTLDGFEVFQKLNEHMEELNEEFKKKIAAIEKAYPRAKDHIKNRIREARKAANLFIADSEEACKQILAPLSNLSY